MISYAPFWQTLKEKNISTYALINKYHISSATIDRMKKGQGISTMKIDDFCEILQCNVEDIIQYLPNTTSKPDTNMRLKADLDFRE